MTKDITRTAPKTADSDVVVRSIARSEGWEDRVLLITTCAMRRGDGNPERSTTTSQLYHIMQ
jgi:hypothetical protein